MVIASLYPEVVHAVVRADSDIHSFSDLAGMRVSVGANGSGTYANAAQLLNSAGLEIKDIQAQYLSFGESADALLNEEIDAMFLTAGVPNAAVEDLASLTPIRLISFDEAALALLLEEHPYYVPYALRPGAYLNVEEDGYMVALTALLVCEQSLDTELVYQMTKALFERTDVITHEKGREITLETALDGVSIPLHPGAEQYYRDRGLLRD